MSTHKKKELIICSLGLFKNQCTLEVLAHIKTCDIVFSHMLDGEISRFLKKLSVRIKIIKNLKPDKTAQAVVSAFKEFDKICFLTYGNPMFLNATTGYLKKEALKTGVKIIVLNAVSSFDAIISLLGLCKFSDIGIRVVDIASCIKDVVVTPEMDTLFFMAGDLNLKGNEKYKNNFIKKLMAAYTQSAEFFMIDTKSIATNSDTLIKGNISDLDKYFSKVNERTTLFLPAINSK
ncbi:MAG: SAM-dependent methyltransferase [Elusimicrobia bacterium]|nr:SAM-dependent methyltransferase [Elusimicrobiota bacterium]